MLKNSGPGKLVVIEGLDGAGTTTQARAISAWLAGRVSAVHVTWEPTDGPVGALVRQVLRRQVTVEARTLAALFVADRMEHLYAPDGVLAKLQAGTWVVMDRYYLSSFAYQSLTLAEDGVAWLYAMHALCVVPDLTLFLDVPVAECMSRIQHGRDGQREIFEKEELLNAALEKYDEAMAHLGSLGEMIVRLDGTQSLAQVTAAIRGALGTLGGLKPATEGVVPAVSVGGSVHLG